MGRVGLAGVHQNYLIGVDVGGTNTDAVLMQGAKVIAACKTATTPSVEDGVIAAISDVIEQSAIAPEAVTMLSIGTTHFTNAFVQRMELDSVGVIRIALPAAKALPPFSGWPTDIADIVGQHSYMVRGGLQYDGSAYASLDEAAIAHIAQGLREAGIESVAISGVFAPVDNDLERRARQIVLDEHTDCSVVLSSEIGRIGLLERENAGIMNAALASLAKRTISGFRTAMARLDLSAPLFIAQNDGTLMSADFVEKYPVLTFASGPTNSMRGAALLSGLEEAIVCDIGGTTTDLGVLTRGFPRESSTSVDIGGVRTNFRMPDILAIGLGGGSLVRVEDGNIRIGPQSVGYRLREEALVFGGSTLTTTDIAVAAGYADVGDGDRVRHLNRDLVEAAVCEVHRMIEDGVDRIKTNPDPAPLVLVGGGRILVDRPLAGVSTIVSHDNADVANAIGASIAQVSGEVDRVYSYTDLGRDKALDEAKAEAKRRAQIAGAEKDALDVIDIEEVPLSYMPGGAVRVRVKVVGPLAEQGVSQ
ncbi:MAG: hydantoinase/oxoprolinase family protein [Pseudomonadota bacterium]